MNLSYFPASQEIAYLPPDAVYVAPMYAYSQQPPPPLPSALPVPSIRVVDTHLAYPRPHSVTANTLPPALVSYDQSPPVWSQPSYSQPVPAAAPPPVHAALPLNGYNSPREQLAADPQLSPIKQHIHQSREEAEDWRRKWMASQVQAWLLFALQPRLSPRVRISPLRTSTEMGPAEQLTPSLRRART